MRLPASIMNVMFVVYMTNNRPDSGLFVVGLIIVALAVGRIIMQPVAGKSIQYIGHKNAIVYGLIALCIVLGAFIYYRLKKRR